MLISEIYHPRPKTMVATATIDEAVEELLKDEVNALVIIDKNKKVVGILSLQDIAAATVPRQFRKNIRMAAAMYKPGFFTEMCQQLKDQPISTVMRKEFVAVDLDDNIMAVTADFLKNDLYIVPVINDGKLLGVVTRSEIKKALHYGMRDVKK
ncbi:MAG TPA: CBS domain-containing protein [Vitreimonas sp.]|nr:CBS domain-containing protein [Vitreimonas sp.]